MKVQNRVVQEIQKHCALTHYRIFLFGSRAAGKAGARSDFDIGIDAGTKIPVEMLSEIRSALEEIPILQKIDLVDLSDVSETFRARALEGAKVIHEQ